MIFVTYMAGHPNFEEILISMHKFHRSVSHSVSSNMYKYNKVHVNRGFYMSVLVLLNLSKELRNRDKMRDLPSIFSLFRDEFNNFNNTGARISDSIYHIKIKIILKIYFWRKKR